MFNALDGTCATLGITCIATGEVGAGLLASGVKLVPGFVLEAITGVASRLDTAGVAVSRRCSAKAAKHEVVRILATSKHKIVHNHISKALEDFNVSDDEYKLVFEEVEKYRAMKEELRRKHAPPAGCLIDEETNNELIKRTREQARASFIKTLADSVSVSLNTLSCCTVFSAGLR